MVSSGWPERRGGRTLREQFAAFPGGRSGVALVFLRIAIGIFGVAEGLNCFAGVQTMESAGFGVVLAASGCLVGVGLFTSYAATGLAIATAFRRAIPVLLSSEDLRREFLPGGLFIAVAVALAMLGPGLFSMDFRLFGHREVVIPRRDQE